MSELVASTGTTTPPEETPRFSRPAPRRLRWIEPTALSAVLFHELTIFRRYWASTTFSSVVEPTIYLLAFGFGFGALVSYIGEYRYVEFLGTGIVATAVLFTSAFTGMFQTFVRRVFQKTYDALLAAPIDTHELVTGEALWIGLKAGVYGCAPMLVAMGFGLDPSPGMLLVPLIGFITGFGFGLFGIWTSTLVPGIDAFNYIISALLTPLFLVAGTFFPIDNLPGWAQTASQFNPLFHCVELVRHAVFGLQPLDDLWHLTALLIFVSAMWLLAIRGMRRKLVT